MTGTVSPRRRTRRRTTVAALVAPLLILPLLMGAAPSSNAGDGGDGVPPTITAVGDADGGPTSVVLVTGDRVVLTPAADGRWSAAVEPKPRADGQRPEFTVLPADDELYVFPSDAEQLLDDTLDRELFNVTKLAANGYTDGVPVVATQAPTGRAVTAGAGLSGTTGLPSVDGFAATVDPDGRWWSTVSTGRAAPGLTAGPQKIWLDELLTVSLDVSVPMIGAPEAWSQGFDGTGSTVAVLDTGVDAEHPDLVGQIAGSKNFTTDPDITDQHGHGTHVASTIAGTGAGSNGRYTGVAPGAELLIGKICDASGTCPTSGTIAAMEWAAPQADVINMSIGTNVGDDGSSPSAMAINELSSEFPDTLFVVAAGNNGTQGAGSVASPGSADAALTVGAVNKSGALAGFSGRGPRMGDYAIKPDVTAPGVAIAAARAGGTSMGTPVNELYTAANGTSMATPHVAGAVAIAMQHDPELTGQQIKAEFMATADPHPTRSIYEQGAGLIDIPAAIGSSVLASRGSVNLGFFAFPQTDTPVAEQTVTYTNRGVKAVTVDLALDVTDADGSATPDIALSLSPASLTIPAGGTADATVRLDVTTLPTGLYGGALTATGGDSSTRTPVGFFIEPEMVDLTLNGTARDGRPATRTSSVYVVDANDPTAPYTEIRFENGVAHGRLAPGTYFLGGRLRTMDGGDQYAQDTTFFGAPTLHLDTDTELTFDAREAKAVSVQTPDHPDSSPVGREQKSVVAYGGQTEDTNFAPQYLGKWSPTYVLGSAPTELRGIEFAQMIRLGAAPLELRLMAPTKRDLFIYPLPGSPAIDSSADLDLVYAGEGTEADYANIDATGKAVLLLRSPEATNYDAVEATARAHGAKAVIIMNNTSGYPLGAAREAQIPAMTITGEEGQQLRELLTAGNVVVNVSGTTWSPYLYDLALLRSDAYPDGVQEKVHTSELVTVQNSFYGESDEPMSEYRALWRPYQVRSAQQYSPIVGAHRRTEYITAGTNSLYRQIVAAQSVSEAPLQERDTVYPRAEQYQHDWFRGVMHPTVLDPAGPRSPGDPVVRQDDTLTMRLAEWSDSNGTSHHGFSDTSTDTSPMKLWVDDQYLGQVARPMVKIEHLPAGDSTLRMQLTTTRTAPWWQTSTRTRTDWTVHTARTAEPALVPILTVDYDTDVDLTNTATPPAEGDRPATLDLRVRQQAGFSGGKVVGAKVWISDDDGATWSQRTARKLQGDGRFTVRLDPVDVTDSSTAYLSLKVFAWATGGNSIEQEVTRVWRIADGT